MRLLCQLSFIGKKIEDLWVDVSDWIYENYVVVEKIYTWIWSGLGHISKAVFVLDDYHQNNAHMRTTGAQPELREDTRGSLRSRD